VRHLKTRTKNKLYYAVVLIFFFSIVLLGNDLFFNEVQGSTSGTVIATVTINPLKVKVQARPHSPFVNKEFTVRATVENLSATTLNDTEATIFLPAGLTLLSEESQFLGSIDENRKKRTSWNVRADEAGFHIIIVAVSAIDNETGNSVASESSIMVEVRTKPGKGLSALWYFFLDIFQ